MMADEKPEVAPVPVAEAAPAPAPEVKPEAPVEAPVAAEPVKEAAPEAPAVPERTPSLLEAAVAPGQDEKPKDTEKPAESKAEEKSVEAKPEEKPKAEEKPAEEKPKEEAKAEEAPKAEEKPAEPAKPEPVEYKYDLEKVAPAIKMDDARRAEVHAAFDAFRTDPSNPAPLFQQAEKMMADYDKALRQQQWDQFAETKKGWRDQVQADEMIGGAGHRTAMQQIAMVRDAFVSDHPRGSEGWKKDVAELNHALDATGAGDHPALLKMLYRAARMLNEPAAPAITDVKPAPDGGRRKGGDSLYDNDRSPRGGPQ